MKQCPHCGTEISESASICDLCVERSVDSTASATEPTDLDSSSEYRSEPAAFGDYTSEYEEASRPEYDTLPDYTSDSGDTGSEAPGDVPPPATLAATKPTVSASATSSKLRDGKLMAIGVGVVLVSVTLGLLIASPGSSTVKPISPAAPASAPASSNVTSAPARRITKTPPVANQVTATFTQKWNSTNRDWIGNQRKAVAFELPAERKVAVWQRQVQLTLVVRCMANRIDAFVFTQSAARMEPQDNDHTVRIAFDGEAESVERWPDSDEHDALFAPDGAAFVSRLAAARTMKFGFTPHNASPVSTDFNIAGLGAIMEPAAKQCGLRK
jgi:hypothetical protein